MQDDVSDSLQKIQDNPLSISRKSASFGRCAQVWPIGHSRLRITEISFGSGLVIMMNTCGCFELPERVSASVSVMGRAVD